MATETEKGCKTFVCEGHGEQHLSLWPFEKITSAYARGLPIVCVLVCLLHACQSDHVARAEHMLCRVDR